MPGFNLKGERIVWLMVLASVILYALDYLVFGRAGEIGFALLGNLAFLPIYVLFVTLMIERLLKEREKESLRRKLNMVIGVFFSEVGTTLLKEGSTFLKDGEGLTERFRITPQWSDREFRELLDHAQRCDFAMESLHGDLPRLKRFLGGKREFLLTLMENPNLLEHDDFTDLLWAAFHLLEELQARHSLAGLPPTDLEHLSGDIRRVFGHLVTAWVTYLHHLQADYPYLFSLAVRTNPLNPAARVEVT